VPDNKKVLLEGAAGLDRQEDRGSGGQMSLPLHQDIRGKEYCQ